MKKDKAEILAVLAALLGVIIVIAIFGLGAAAFVTWVVGMFFEYPFTWANVGKAFLVMMAINLVLGATRIIK